MRSQLAVLVTVGVLAMGCGSDDEGGGGDEELQGRDAEVASALAEVMGRNLTTENGKVASECTASAIVGEVGADRVIEGGLLTEDLEVPRRTHDFYPPEVAEAVAVAYVQCWDVDAQVEDVRAAIPNVEEARLEAFGDCMRAIPDSVIHDTYLNATLEGGDPQKAQALGNEIAKCQAKLS